MHTYSRLFPYLLTPTDRDRVVECIKKMQAQEFILAQSTQSANEVSRIVEEIIKADPKKISGELVAFLSSLPVVRLTVASTPSPEELRDYVQNIQHDDTDWRLVEVIVDATLLGGAQISAHGKLHDASLAYKLEEFLTSEKGKTTVLAHLQLS